MRSSIWLAGWRATSRGQGAGQVGPVVSTSEATTPQRRATPAVAAGYYVTREAIEEGYASCPVTSVSAGDVEGAVLDRVQRLFGSPELVARAWAAAKRTDDNDVAEREVTALLADFASGPSCFPPSRRGSSSSWSSG